MKNKKENECKIKDVLDLWRIILENSIIFNLTLACHFLIYFLFFCFIYFSFFFFEYKLQSLYYQVEYNKNGEKYIFSIYFFDFFSELHVVPTYRVYCSFNWKEKEILFYFLFKEY